MLTGHYVKVPFGDISMKLSEAKLRQIVREELVRDYKRKLKEDAESRQANRAARHGAETAWRKERDACLDVVKTKRGRGEGKKDNPAYDPDYTWKQAMADRKACRKKARADLRAELQSIEVQKRERKLTDAQAEEARRELVAAELGDGVGVQTPKEIEDALAQLDADAEAEEARRDQAAASVDVPTKLLKVGSRGEEVIMAQKLLAAAGFDPMGEGEQPDGKFGGQTKTAVVSFQEDQGLKGDGIVGSKTWAKLVRFSAESGSGEVEEESEEAEVVSELTRKKLRTLISRELRRL